MSSDTGDSYANGMLSPLVVTADEAARMLAISVRKLWDLVRSGDLVPVAVGKRSTRFDVDDLRDYIKSRKVR